MASCDSSIDISQDIQINSDGLSVFCHINKLKTKHVSAKDKGLFNIKTDDLSFLYGEIILSNTTNHDITYDLNDYYLSIGTMISSHIYIDSVASQIIRETTIKPTHTIRKYVYWVFDDSWSKDELMKINLIIKKH
jgi:hypothetical protein